MIGPGALGMNFLEQSEIVDQQASDKSAPGRATREGHKLLKGNSLGTEKHTQVRALTKAHRGAIPHGHGLETRVK